MVEFEAKIISHSRARALVGFFCLFFVDFSPFFVAPKRDFERTFEKK